MQENTNGVFRKKKVYFTQVSNNILDDNSLSWKAKGIYSTIQRFITLEKWDLTVGHLISLSKDGEKSFDSGWKELKDKGYLKQYRIPSKAKKGTFRYEYDLLDVADTTTPSLINCDINGNIKLKVVEIKDHIPQNGGDGNKDTRPYPPKRIVCLKDSMLNGGDIYNTNINNTNINNTNINNTNSIIYQSKSKKYCTITPKEIIDRQIDNIKLKTLTNLSKTALRKFLNVANGDEELVVDVYNNVMLYLSNNQEIKIKKSLEAFVLASIKNEVAETQSVIFK